MRIKPPQLLNLSPRLTPYLVMVNSFRFFLVTIGIGCLFLQWINPHNERPDKPLPPEYGIWLTAIFLVAWISMLVCVGAMSLMFIRLVFPERMKEPLELEKKGFLKADARFDAGASNPIRITD